MSKVSSSILSVLEFYIPSHRWASVVLAGVSELRAVGRVPEVIADPSAKLILEDMHIRFVPTLQEALDIAVKEKGENAKIAVIPEGISVIDPAISSAACMNIS